MPDQVSFGATAKHTNLLCWDWDFCFKPCPRLEKRRRPAGNQLE